tara:strand:+ start:321 stop:914 length:594 start_codon:yes stop_codon:yes gene_type:complete
MDIKQIIREELKVVLSENTESPYYAEQARLGKIRQMGHDDAVAGKKPSSTMAIYRVGYDAGMKSKNEKPKSSGVREAAKADKDYDGDGKIESSEDEWKGSRDKAIKKAVTETLEGILSEEEGEKGMSMDDAMASVYTQYSRAKFLQLLDDIDKRVMDLRSGNPMKYSGAKTPFYAIRGAIQDIKDAAEVEIKDEDEE